MNISDYNQSVDNLSDNLYRFILKNFKDEEKSKDVVQEAFTRLWLKIDDVSAEKVKSYLFTTAYHIMIDMIRADKKRGSMEEADMTSRADSKGYSDLNEILHLALDRLPVIQKSVIMLRDYEGYSYEEIGKILNLTESQVKVYIFRARKFLKSYLGSVENVL